jgi:hypothetical protein
MVFIQVKLENIKNYKPGGELAATPLLEPPRSCEIPANVFTIVLFITKQ